VVELLRQIHDLCCKWLTGCVMHCGWVYRGKGGDTRKRNTDNRKPEVRTAATLVLVREGLEHEWWNETAQTTAQYVQGTL